MSAITALQPDTFESEYRAYQSARRAFWDEVARNESHSWGGYYHTQLERVYQHLIPEGASVLEVGCGTGRLLAALKPATGVGVDFSEDTIAAARREHPELEFIVADAHELE